MGLPSIGDECVHGLSGGELSSVVKEKVGFEGLIAHYYKNIVDCELK